MAPRSISRVFVPACVVLLLAIHASDAAGQGSGVVNPPQTQMIVNFSQARVVEADGAAVVNVQVTFAFDIPALASTWSGERPLTISYTTEDGTARAGTCGTGGADYVATSNAFTFTGQQSQTVNFQICSDDLSEGDEQFGVRLTAAENHANFFISFSPGRVPQQVTITDDEPLPTLGITPTAQVAEPFSGTANVEFVVSLSGPINQRPVTVQFNTSPGTASAGTTCPPRTANADYITKSGTLTFSPPTNLLQSPQIPRAQRVQVVVCADTNRIETAETFFVNLAGAVNATLAGTGGPLSSAISSPKEAVTRGQATIN
jgi:hypothetical protein